MGEIGEGTILQTNGIIDLQSWYARMILIVLLLRKGSGLFLTGKEVLIEDAVLVLGVLTLSLPRSLVNGLLVALFLAGKVVILVECLFGFLLELPGCRLHGRQLLSGSRFILVEIIEEVEAVSEVLSWDEVIISCASSCEFVLY